MSPFLDDRGRLFGKVSVVDLVVVLLLIALVAFAYIRFAAGTGTEKDYRLTLTVEKVRRATFAQFKEGDVVHDDAGTPLGRIESFSVEPTPTEVADDRGNLFSRPSPVFSDVTVVIRGRGAVSASTIRAGSIPLRVGKVLTLIGPGYEVKTQIMGVELVGG
ncbi:MAG: hypothetical protein Kow00122_18250 [Thermoleophilia bacterium]